MAEAVTITEVTGLRRAVRLFDRALPYQELSTGREQHYVQRWYPGCPVGSIQVQGPRLPDWTMHGMWKTKFLAGQYSVELENFDDIRVVGGRIVAEDLIEAFNRICTDGQTIDVRWGPESRRGIMTAFVPTWINLDDIKWEVTFAWTSIGEFNDSFRATGVLDSVKDVQWSLDQLDLTVAEMPASITGDQRTLVERGASAVRSAGAEFTSVLGRIQAAKTTTIEMIQNAATYGERVVQAANALRTGMISDLPYYELIAVDDVGIVLASSIFRLDVSSRSANVAATSRQASTSVSERVAPGPLAIVTITENTTLRTLARRYYGDADAWTFIADANGLIGSIAPIGTRVVVPRPPAQGFARR